MLKKVLLGCGLPLLIVSLLAGLAARTLLKRTPKPERSEIVRHGDVEIKVIETGTIEPLRKVDVKSKAGGRILKLFVDEGAIVRQGQILATIDPQEVNSQVAGLRAQLAGAQARLQSARTNVGFQQSQTHTGINQYRQNLAAAKARLQSAEAEAGVQPTLTQQNIEMAQSNLDASRAQLKAQRDSLDLMTQSTHPNAIVAAEAAYEQARAQADNAQHNVERQRQLLKDGFVSRQVVDSAEADARVAASHVTETKSRLDRLPRTNVLEETNLRSQIQSAESQVRQMETALSQARATVLPTTKLRELDSARAAYAQAQAQLEQAQGGTAQDRMRMADASAAASEVQQIQQQLNERLVSQSDTTLYAPMEGVVTKRYAEVGDLIASALATFSAGSPVYQIADVATMLVKMNVNEVDINKIRVGLPTEVTIDASKGAMFPGHVRKVATSALVDASGANQSVIRFPVEIQVEAQSGRKTSLRPGQSARCAIIVGRHKNVLRLPVNCVQGEGGKGTVKIVTATVKNGDAVETVTPREVTVGLRGDDFVEIVAGLQDGDKVRPNPYSGPARKEIDIKMGD